MSLEWVKRETLEVAVAVIEDGRGRLLVTRRERGAHLEGRWEFPGGKVKKGETHKAAVARECKEELGVDVTVGDLVIPRDTFKYPDRVVALSFFRCKLAPGSPKPEANEADELQWVERARLKELEWPDANKALIRALSAPPTAPATETQPKA